MSMCGRVVRAHSISPVVIRAQLRANELSNSDRLLLSRGRRSSHQKLKTRGRLQRDRGGDRQMSFEMARRRGDGVSAGRVSALMEDRFGHEVVVENIAGSSSLDFVPSIIPISSIAMMVRGVTEQEDGTVYMRITEPGAGSFPDIFEHGDNVYGRRINPNEGIKIGSIVAYVLKRGTRESNLQIGRVIAGPGCSVSIKDRLVNVEKEGEDYRYEIFEPEVKANFRIHSQDKRYLIITESNDGEQVFLDIDGISPLLIHRDLLRFVLTRVHGYRIQQSPRVDDVRSSVRQAEVQGEWDLRLVMHDGKIYTVNAIGPSKRVDDDGVDLLQGDLLISPVAGGQDKIVSIRDIDARVVVYSREL